MELYATSRSCSTTLAKKTDSTFERKIKLLEENNDET